MGSPTIALSIPTINGSEWTYVKECLDTGWVSSAGPFVERFEREFAAYVGARHAIACVNGTAALTLALRVAGVRADDEVIVPTATFIAPVNAAQYLGARPVFMDCDDFYNVDVAKVAEFLDEHTTTVGAHTRNRSTGRRIAAIVAVHIFGNAARLEALQRVCAARNLPLVEDACEALGTRYRSGPLAGVHAGMIGRLGCFSFNGNKIVTTGGGGMVVTNDDALASEVRYLSTQAKDDEVRYVHGAVGYNYRLTNLQAALGVAQLEQLPEFLRIKRKNFELYRQGLEGIAGLTLAAAPPYAENNLWMYALRIDSRRYGRDREATMSKLAAAGIQSRPLWHLNHLQKPYADCQSFRIERALELHATTLNIPCSTSLSGEDVARVLEALRT
jgi:perosamine synthetase